MAASVIDLNRIREQVRQFAVALEDPERIDQLEAIVARSLGPGR